MIPSLIGKGLPRANIFLEEVRPPDPCHVMGTTDGGHVERAIMSRSLSPVNLGRTKLAKAHHFSIYLISFESAGNPPSGAGLRHMLGYDVL
jgi:hypothetical protein